MRSLGRCAYLYARRNIRRRPRANALHSLGVGHNAHRFGARFHHLPAVGGLPAVPAVAGAAEGAPNEWGQTPNRVFAIRHAIRSSNRAYFFD